MVRAAVAQRPASPESRAKFCAGAVGPLRAAVLPRWPLAATPFRIFKMPVLLKPQDEEPVVIILGRSMNPLYTRATVEGDIRKLIRAYSVESGRRALSINDVTRYIEYLESRYPKLRPLGHITPQLFQGNGLETYFEPALKNYSDFARQQQTEINTKRQNYLNRHGHCQFCSFAFTPLLQVHHVIPIFRRWRQSAVSCVMPDLPQVDSSLDCHQIQ